MCPEPPSASARAFHVKSLRPRSFRNPSGERWRRSLICSIGLGRCWPRTSRPTLPPLPSASTSATARACTRSGTDHRLEAMVGRRAHEGVRGSLGGLERPRRSRVQRAGPAPRSPRSSSPGVRGETVLCPSNTFMATPLARSPRARRSSSSTATVTTSACRSRTSSARSHRHKPKAAFLVHIGGHIAFDIERIAELCRAEGIVADRGLRPRPRRRRGTAARPGTFGDAGIWSFAPTKTISTGEGGMLVSRHEDADRVRARVPQLRQARLRGRTG